MKTIIKKTHTKTSPENNIQSFQQHGKDAGNYQHKQLQKLSHEKKKENNT